MSGIMVEWGGLDTNFVWNKFEQPQAGPEGVKYMDVWNNSAEQPICATQGVVHRTKYRYVLSENRCTVMRNII